MPMMRAPKTMRTEPALENTVTISSVVLLPTALIENASNLFLFCSNPARHENANRGIFFFWIRIRSAQSGPPREMIRASAFLPLCAGRPNIGARDE